MLVELLYVPGCPHYEPALSRLRQVLQSQKLPVAIREIPVTDEAMARSLRFPGSPTIRINHQDVEPDGGTSPALACRLYGNGTSAPSEEAIRRAISAAKGEAS
jgi:hypothetical protein